MSTYQHHTNCPHCANQINYNDEHTGHETPCPSCGKGVVLSKQIDVRGVLSRGVIFCVLWFVGIFLFWQATKLLSGFLTSGSSSVDCPKCKATVSVKNDTCYRCNQVKMGITLSSGYFYATCGNCKGGQTKKCGKCGFGRD